MLDKTLNIRGTLTSLATPLVMGILNITPDSFYAGSRKQTETAIEDRIREILSDGAAIINDISGGELDADMFQTVADLKVPYIMMHMRGTPQTMQRHTDYPDMMEEIMLYFSRKVRQLRLLGVNDIILDPGFGFSKTLEQNYQLMSHLKEFSIFELPLLVGVSRKSMIYKLLGGTPADSLNGTTVLNTYALLNGANILRVHDVREAVEAIRVIGQMTNK